MKTLSTILTYLLFIAVLNLIGFIIRDYNQFKELGIEPNKIVSLEPSIFIYLISYVMALSLSIFLNKKKKYVLNVIISGLMAVLYIAAIIFMVIAF
jgi:hypothetical protein